MLTKQVTRVTPLQWTSTYEAAPSSFYGQYVFETVSGTYYYSDGEKWNQIQLDTDEAAPDTETSIICGVRVTDNSIAPIKVDDNGGLIVAGNSRAAAFTRLSGVTTSLATTGVQIVSGAYDGRLYFFFQNLSDADMNLEFVAPGENFNASSNSIRVGKGGNGIIFDKIVPTNTIKLYCPLVDKRFVAYEV